VTDQGEEELGPVGAGWQARGMDDANRRCWAILIARLILALIFFMAGVWKVFGLGPLEHARRLFVEPYARTFLPTWSLWATGTVVPFVELVAGALLLVGYRIRDSLLALGGVLVLVTFGHLLAEPLYEFHTHVIPRAALLLFVLVMPAEQDRFSVEGWMRARRRH
jgi:thiosulfate dehydrogenase (quinone) large subunit